MSIICDVGRGMRKGVISKKHESELLLLAFSLYFKDHFHTFEVSISYSIAEIELIKNKKALKRINRI